jgi:hypothetical protein
MARILVSLAQGCEEFDVVTDSAMRGAAEMGLQR